MGQINTNNYPTVDSLADADLLIVENAIHGTGTTTPKQLRENAIGTDPLQTIAQTVTGAINEIFEMATDTVIGLELGKMTSFSDGVIVTDIDLHREPAEGDRILFYHSSAVASPSSLTTYNDGVAVTKSIMDFSMTHPIGLTLMEFGLLGWTTVQDIAAGGYTAGTGISINGTTISNSAPQLGDDIAYSRIDTVTSGALGYFSADADCLVMDFRTDAEPYNGGYTLRLTTTGASFKYAVLKDKAGNNYAEEIPSGSLVMCKSNVSGTGSEADPVVVTVLEIGNTEMAHDVEVLKDICITEKTATGNPITLTDALPYAALSLSADIEPIQDLHGYDKPWVGGADINKCNPDAVALVTSDTGTQRYGLVFDAAGTYTLSAGANLDSGELDIRTFDGETYTWVGALVTASAHNTYTLTIASGEKIILFGPLSMDLNAVKAALTAGEVMIESGSTAHAYRPYSNICPISGHTSVTITRTDAESQTADFTIQLGQTVYGGTVNFVTGEARITYAIEDMGDLTWNYVSNIVGFYTDDLTSAMKKPTSNIVPLNGLCEAYPIVAREGISYEALCANVNGRIVVRTALFGTNATVFTTAMDGVQLCYELATPIELTLSPVAVEMLKGYNQISSDGGGSMSITYKADRIAALEAALAAL